MNKERIKGIAKQATGNIKTAAGRIVGDARLVDEGKKDIVEGKVRNAVGTAADAVKATKRR